MRYVRLETFNYNPHFPTVKNWGRGGYYVMPILGDCTLYVPTPPDNDNALDFIDDVEQFSLDQYARQENMGMSVEFTLEPGGDFKK